MVRGAGLLGLWPSAVVCCAFNSHPVGLFVALWTVSVERVRIMPAPIMGFT